MNAPDFFSDYDEATQENNAEVEESIPNFFEDEKPKTDYNEIVSSQLKKRGIPVEYGKGEGDALKSVLSGATLGLTENLPGMQPEEDSFSNKAFKFAGELLPITKAFKYIGKPLLFLAKKSPYIQKSLTTLANITTAGLTGSAINATEDAFKGKSPNAEQVFEHGLEWALLDTGLRLLGKAGQFTANLLNKSRSANKPSWEIVNETINKMRSEGVDFSTPDTVAAKALSILEQPLEKAGESVLWGARVNQSFQNLDKGIEGNAIGYLPQEFSFPKTADELIESQLSSKVESLGNKSENLQKLGQDVKDDIAGELKKAESSYEPLYEEVEKSAKNLEFNPRKTTEITNNILKDIKSLKTKPEGYQKVISTLEDLLFDLGQGGEIPISRMMELGRRLNKIIDYDIIGSSIKNQLKPVVKSLKSETRQALGKYSPNLSKKFDQAEKLYGETAQKFGKDSILKIRGEESPEKISSIINSPSGLKDLKQTISPESYNKVQRELIENLRNQTQDKANSTLREIKQYLDPKFRSIAEEIVQAKIPRKITPLDKIKNAVLDEIAKSIESGLRPSKTLDLWKTRKGQNIVKSILEGNPNKKEILHYLQKQSFNDVAKSVIKNGKLDFNKLKEFLKDPAFQENLRSIGGEDAVNFFQNLESYAKQFDTNLKLLDKMPKNIEATYGDEILKRMGRRDQPLKAAIDSFFDKLGLPAKTAIGVLSSLKLGIPSAAGSYIAFRMLYKLASSRKARTAFINVSKGKSSNPISLILALDNLNKELEE